MRLPAADPLRGRIGYNATVSLWLGIVKKLLWMGLGLVLAVSAGCVLVEEGAAPAAERGTVITVIDRDTIDVRLADGAVYRVRYIGIDTPERDQVCYREATAAGRALVAGQTVTLRRDRATPTSTGACCATSTWGIRSSTRGLWPRAGPGGRVPAGHGLRGPLPRAGGGGGCGERGCHPTGVFR